MTRAYMLAVELWRVLVHPFVFANSTELLMGELLLYNVGVGIERCVLGSCWLKSC